MNLKLVLHDSVLKNSFEHKIISQLISCSKFSKLTVQTNVPFECDQFLEFQYVA